jgi:7-carboxy-7-deazaguanine synthase
MKNLMINSIYRATEGEGIFVGIPCIFVRFQGCALACKNCDSPETWSFNIADTKSVEEVYREIKKETFSEKIKRVSITGGDPLHPKHLEGVIALAIKLKSEGYYINVEASGNTVAKDLFDIVDFISFDFKTPSSGLKASPNLIVKMGNNYRNKFQIKSVIADHDDFLAVQNSYAAVVSQLDEIDFPWILTPAYNVSEKFPQELFVNCLKWNEAIGGLFRVIGQQHKWIFGPDKKLV